GAAYGNEPVRYDLLKDFTPIGMLGQSPTVLIARKALNLRNFPDLVAAAKAKPGQLSFVGVQSYTGEYLETMAGIRLNLILYKGAGQALTDLMGERIDMMVGTVSDMLQHVQGGKFTAVALNSPSAVPQLPGVQPVADTIPNYRGGQWYGLFVPAKTPEAVVARLRTELARSVQAPGYAALMAKLSMFGPDRDVAAFTQEVRATLESFQKARQLGRPAG
ncbi:MAG TPA: tripartite tricarboxylate transporter substrate-binding protein, partial [Ramlibacter sp.]|nr:tripartite tricarboxylate transporter substrate-binding protein [Ramlibacter sp.]